MNGLFIGLSGLRTSQIGIQVASDNIANANTPGFQRRSMIQRDRSPVNVGQHLIGTGVDVENIRRIRNELIESSLVRQTSVAGQLAAESESLNRIESLFVPGDGSIHDRMQLFLNGLQELAARPEDTSVRRVALERGVRMTEDLRGLSLEFERIRIGLDDQIRSTIDEVNRIADEVAALHRQIPAAESKGLEASSLRGRRDELVNRLSELIDVRAWEQPGGQPMVGLARSSVVVGQRTQKLQGTISADGFAVTRESDTDPLPIDGGRLAGLLRVRNDLLVQFEGELDRLAGDVIAGFNAVHGTGVGASGSFTVLQGRFGMSATDVPLAKAHLAFPPQAGELYVSVTNPASGERSLVQVDINPDTHSLEDVAAILNGIDHLGAGINSGTNTLTLFTEHGFEFDFSGRLPTQLDSAAISGTTRVAVSGQYAGQHNDQYTIEADRSGTVGVTPELVVSVRDRAGDLVATLDVGGGYSPGAPIAAGNGVSFEFTAGTINIGDTASTAIVRDPDSSGLLAALGLNTMFEGSSAGDIRIADQLLTNPDRFAISASGESGDAVVLGRMIELRDALAAAGGSRTFEQAITDLTTNIGNQTAQVSSVKQGIDIGVERLLQERNSVSGVDANEELVSLLQYQRAFQAASRVISTIDRTFDDLFQMIR